MVRRYRIRLCGVDLSGNQDVHVLELPGVHQAAEKRAEPESDKNVQVGKDRAMEDEGRAAQDAVQSSTQLSSSKKSQFQVNVFSLEFGLKK